MLSSAIEGFHWILYAFDAEVFQPELYAAQLQHRAYEEDGHLYLQKYHILENKNVDSAFIPPNSDLDYIIKLFTFKKWMLGMVLLHTYEVELRPAILSRLISYTSYYQQIEDKWLKQKDPDVLHRWWRIESTRRRQHHTPSETLDFLGQCSNEDTVKKACVEWRTAEIWEADDISKVPLQKFLDASVYVRDWIKRGIIMDEDGFPESNAELYDFPGDKYGYERKSVLILINNVVFMIYTSSGPGGQECRGSCGGSRGSTTQRV